MRRGCPSWLYGSKCSGNCGDPLDRSVSVVTAPTQIARNDSPVSGAVGWADELVPVHVLDSMIELADRRVPPVGRARGWRVALALVVGALVVGAMVMIAGARSGSSRGERAAVPAVARSFSGEGIGTARARPRARRSGRGTRRRWTRRRTTRRRSSIVGRSQIVAAPVRASAQPAASGAGGARVEPDALAVTCEFEPSCGSVGRGP